MTVTEGNLPVGETGEKLDTTKVTQTDGSVVHREAVVVADPENNDARLRLEEFPFGIETRFAVPITGMELKMLCGQMATLIEGQRVTNLYLSRLICESLTTDDLEDY